MAFDYSGLVESQLRGQLPPDVINQIAQRAAERGVATGSPGGPGANAAYLAAIGRTSLDLVGQGQKAYEAQQQIALENARLSEQASEFAANMTLDEKKLAQALGISNQEFALEKAKLAEQERQFNVGTAEAEKQFGLEQSKFAEGQREFDVGTGLKQQAFGETQREFNVGQANAQQRFAEDVRRFGLEYAMANQKQAESSREFNVSHALDVPGFQESQRQFNVQYPLALAKLTPQQLSNLSFISPGTVPSYFRSGGVYPSSWNQSNMFTDRFMPQDEYGYSYQMPGDSVWHPGRGPGYPP